MFKAPPIHYPHCIQSDSFKAQIWSCHFSAYDPSMTSNYSWNKDQNLYYGLYGLRGLALPTSLASCHSALLAHKWSRMMTQWCSSFTSSSSPQGPRTCFNLCLWHFTSILSNQRFPSLQMLTQPSYSQVSLPWTSCLGLLDVLIASCTSFAVLSTVIIQWYLHEFLINGQKVHECRDVFLFSFYLHLNRQHGVECLICSRYSVMIFEWSMNKWLNSGLSSLSGNYTPSTGEILSWG